MFMLLRVEVHPGLLLMGVNFGYSHHTAAHRGRGGLDEYHTVPPDRRPLAVLHQLSVYGWAAARDGGRSAQVPRKWRGGTPITVVIGQRAVELSSAPRGLAYESSAP